jgi:hypothetical protein
MSVQIVRRHFNISEYYRMTDAGILSQGDRVELLDGEVAETSPIRSHHVEVADSSTQFDREIKLPLYSQAMLQEVWLVNLPDDTLESYSQPADGAYRITQTLKRGEALVSTVISGLNLDVAAILG